MPHIEPKPQRGIVAVACQLSGVTISLPAPARHYDVLWAMDALGLDPNEADQGFLDHRGVYLGRKTAMLTAMNWGQIAESEADAGGELFSEHLW